MDECGAVRLAHWRTGLSAARRLPAFGRRLAGGIASVCLLTLSCCGAQAGSDELPPIKGLRIGMPIEQAVEAINERAGPIMAGSVEMLQAGADPAEKPRARPDETDTRAQAFRPFKVMRVPAERVAELRRELFVLLSLMTMQFYQAEPSVDEDFFMVVPANWPDTATDVGEVGLGLVQALLVSGFFAWGDAEGRVNLFLIGPTLGNALFDAAFMSSEEFASRFARAYDIPRWTTVDESSGSELLIYESAGGPSVALVTDALNRRTVVVWNKALATEVPARGEGAFD